MSAFDKLMELEYLIVQLKQKADRIEPQWTPQSGERMFMNFSDEWRMVYYIGFDLVRMVHVGRTPEHEGGKILESVQITPYKSKDYGRHN